MELRKMREISILELGCSYGFLLKEILQRLPVSTSAQLNCIEPSLAFSEKAQKTLASLNATFSLVNRTWNASLLRVGSIDLFMSSHVLEHMPNLCIFLKELHGTLASGWLFFSEVPNHSHRYLKTKFGGDFHLTFPTASGIRNT